MKLLLTFLFSLYTIVVSAQVDTLSYAIGYRTTFEKLINHNQNLPDTFRLRFIKGMEENKLDKRFTDDLEYRVNYLIGNMQSLFMFNYFEHAVPKQDIPLNSLIYGLMLVADNKLNLPEDTIAISHYMSKISKFEKFTDIPDSIRGTVLRNVGIQWAFSPDLAENVDMYCIDKKLKANHQALARGMADGLMISQKMEAMHAYDMGKFMIRTLFLWMTPLNMEHFSQEDFIEGAKAALGLVPLLIDKDELEKRLGKENEKERIEQIKRTYVAVNWNMTLVPVAIRRQSPQKAVTAFTTMAKALSGQHKLAVDKEELKLSIPSADIPFDYHS